MSVGTSGETLAKGGSFDAKRITPPILAEMLERDTAKRSARQERSIRLGNASLMYEVADIKTWANLGLHLAEKLKGAMALHTYRLSGGAEKPNSKPSITCRSRWDTGMK